MKMKKDFDRISKAFKVWYGVNLESKEHALRGWNWGKTEFTKAELVFNVQNRPDFEIPYSEVSNTNLAGKNEVAVEFALGDGLTGEGKRATGGTKNLGRKAAAGPDELVEMRFYIPGTVAKKETGGEGAKKDENGEEEEDGEKEEKEEEEEEEEADGVEEQNAANLFYETLMDKAEIGDVAGDTFATFLDVLHLTPRCVKIASIQGSGGLLTLLEGAVLISICTSLPFGYAARHTTTRSSIRRSRSSFSSRRMMIRIFSSSWGSTRLFGKDRHGILSLSCS